MVAFRADEVGHLQLARAGAEPMTTWEKRAHHHVAAIRLGQLVHDLRTALGVGRVILEQDLDRAAADAAAVIDQLQGGLCGALVPAAIAGPDAGPVQLEADLDRRGLRGDMSGQARGQKPAHPRPSAGRGGWDEAKCLSSCPSLHCCGLCSGALIVSELAMEASRIVQSFHPVLAVDKSQRPSTV